MYKKWDKGYAGKANGNFSSGAANYKKPFTPKKPVKTFRDLDIYQTTLQCSVIVVKNFRPKLVALKYPFIEGMVNCTMSVPLLIAEAHSLRFADFALGVGYLEKAMSANNKMVVYLEHAKAMYGSKVDADLYDEIIARYVESRTKSFHLEKSWKRFRTEYGDANSGKGKGGFKY